MDQRIAVIGLGRFGMKLAQALAAAGTEVIAIDSSRQIIEHLRDQVGLAVKMDATEQDALISQGIDNVDVAVVAIGTDFEANALITSTLKAIGVSRVISRAGSERRGVILKRIGADQIVFPEHESANQWVHRLLLPKLIQSIELGEGHSLAQVPAPKEFCDKTLGQLKLRVAHRVNLVAIRRPIVSDQQDQEGTYQIVMPMADTHIRPDDILWLVGSNDAIAALPSA